MPAIYHEGSWLGNATDPEVLVKDTVGWTGKNLLKNKATTQTINGVTFTVNADGSVKVNGTASSNTNVDIYSVADAFRPPIGRYIISRGGAKRSNVQLFVNKYNGTNRVSQVTNLLDTNEFEFDVDYDGYDRLHIGLWVDNGTTVSNLMLYPMLRKADITDPTYEPYHESVEVMYEEEIHGVNLLKVKASTQTISGVTFTVNADKSVTVNGTATANADFGIVIPSDVFAPPAGEYIISRGGSLTSDVQLYVNLRNETNHVRQITNLLSVEEFKFTLDYNGYDRIAVGIFVNSGKTINNFVIKPMLRKADIEDSTYRPYNYQAIQNQLNVQGVLGAKNLLKSIAKTSTLSGVTFTVNADGSIKANGTATSMAQLVLSSRFTYDLQLPKGKYRTTGCPKNGGGNSYYFAVAKNKVTGDSSQGYDNLGFDYGNGVTFELTETSDIQVLLTVASGTTVNNLMSYPMIRLASDPDDTYQPYAMTNRELTEEKINIVDLKAVVSASSDFADFKTRIASL